MDEFCDLGRIEGKIYQQLKFHDLPESGRSDQGFGSAGDDVV